MAKVTNAYDTYTSVNKREDYVNAIYMVSPEATPFLSRLGKTEVSNTLHEWQVDDLGSAVTTAQLEGSTVSLNAVTPTTRVHNYCMILKDSAVVTKTQEAVKKAGVTSDLAREIEKAIKRLKLGIDTLACGYQPEIAGDATHARQARGLEHWLFTNDNRAADGAQAASSTAAVTDGTQRYLDEDILKATLQTCYNNGADPKVLYCGSFNKGKISGFVGRSTTQVQVAKNTVSAAVDYYEGDFHKLEIVPSRNVRSRSILLVDPEFVKIAYLRPFDVSPYDQIGDAIGKEVVVEWTVEVRNEKAHGLIADLKTA